MHYLLIYIMTRNYGEMYSNLHNIQINKCN